MKELLAQIEAQSFTCGIVLWNDRVIEAAPIVGYMKGWPRERVRDYCRQRGWSIKVVHELARTTH